MILNRKLDEKVQKHEERNEKPHHKFHINLVLFVMYWEVFAFVFSAQVSVIRRSISTKTSGT